MSPTDKPAATGSGEPKCPTCGTDTSWSKGWPCWDTWHDAEPTPPASQPTLDRETAALREEVERLKGALENIATALDDAQIGKAGLICIAALSQKGAENERNMVGD